MKFHNLTLIHKITQLRLGLYIAVTNAPSKVFNIYVLNTTPDRSKSIYDERKPFLFSMWLLCSL